MSDRTHRDGAGMDDRSIGILDEAYQRLHTSGPERVGGWLTNHAPMAVEALARNGHAAEVHPWIDRYQDELDEVPRGVAPVTEENWREALGDPHRLGDWPVWFRHRLAEDAWEDVLATWWPRLLPGIAAGATHGVIRVGHAVRVLREDGPDEARVEELAQALGYWAARWQPVPGVAAPGGGLDARAALDAVPLVAERTGNVGARLAQLPDTPGWTGSLTALRAPHGPDPARDQLAEVVDAAVLRYLARGHGNATMLVHSATAPTAVLRTLPSLPRDQWERSAAIGWAAAGAVSAAYGPDTAAEPETLPAAPPTAQDAFAAAAEHGDEHVVKFADAALDAFARTADPAVLAAAVRARDLHEPRAA